MPQPPEPVHAFFARFLESQILESQNPESLRDFCIDLLDLEVSRAQIALYDLPGEVGRAYKYDANRALRVLRVARRRKWREDRPFDPAWFWLTLLGHRLALERGLTTGGIPTLAVVASRRLNLPLEETRLWSCDTLFEKYTRTVLRAQWDYRGLQASRPDAA